MDLHDVALIAAGVIGSGVAVFHGVLTQRYIVRPLVQRASQGKRLPAPIIRLVPGLLHFSTFIWFLGGLALIAAASWSGQGARLTTSLLVGGAYLYGALGNLWATRGRHPGWMLMAVAVVLIAFSAGHRDA